MVGQYSLMPGQCPGLPGSGYTTVDNAFHIEKSDALAVHLVFEEIIVPW